MGSAPSKITDGASKKSSSRLSSRKSGPSYYNPATFIITAYLPYDGGKRLKVRNTPTPHTYINLHKPQAHVVNRFEPMTKSGSKYS